MFKILCFTVSYNRPYYIYNTINNILNQSYQDFEYSVKINIDFDNEKDNYEKLLKDFSTDSRLKITYGKNESQQNNYISSINSLYNNHDLLIKIDDDDIYHRNYLKCGIDLFEKSNADIISFTSFIHINNKKIYDKMEGIGLWKGDHNAQIKFGMPPTYFFNQRAFDLIKNLTNQDIRKIHTFEDAAWRTVWRKNNLKSLVYDNNIFTYHIHGNNISSKFLYKNNDHEDIVDIENEYCMINTFKHPNWTSILYFNKRNNRVYNIKNNDHGRYRLLNNNTIEIIWDSYAPETFTKSTEDDCFHKI